MQVWVLFAILSSLSTFAIGFVVSLLYSGWDSLNKEIGEAYNLIKNCNSQDKRKETKCKEKIYELIKKANCEEKNFKKFQKEILIVLLFLVILPITPIIFTVKELLMKLISGYKFACQQLCPIYLSIILIFIEWLFIMILFFLYWYRKPLRRMQNFKDEIVKTKYSLDEISNKKE